MLNFEGLLVISSWKDNADVGRHAQRAYDFCGRIFALFKDPQPGGRNRLR